MTWLWMAKRWRKEVRPSNRAGNPLSRKPCLCTGLKRERCAALRSQSSRWKKRSDSQQLRNAQIDEKESKKWKWSIWVRQLESDSIQSIKTSLSTWPSKRWSHRSSPIPFYPIRMWKLRTLLTTTRACNGSWLPKDHPFSFLFAPFF